MKLKLRPAHYLILLGGALFFVFPLMAAVEFSLRTNQGKSYGLANYRWFLHQDGFRPNLFMSFKLAALTAILVLALMVPTVVYTHLGGAKWRRLIEFICLVPLVVPVVSFAIGAITAMPTIFQSSPYELSFLYVIISLPYTYRALDVGLSSVPLTTLVEASRSIGASSRHTLQFVVVPSIRSAVNGAIFLAIALSLGEFTLAVLLHWDTFPTWINNVSQDNVLGAISLSVFALFGAIFIVLIVALAPNIRKSEKIEESA